MPFLGTTGSPILQVSLFVPLFLWLSVSIGRRAFRLLGSARTGSAAERAFIALILGSGLLQFVPFALGAVGFLNTTSIRIALLVLAVLSIGELRPILLGLRSWFKVRDDDTNWVRLCGLVLVPALLLAFLRATTPTTDPDGLSYHLTVPKRWLQSGSLEYLPTYPYSNTPMGAEMLFAIGLAVGGDVTAKVLHFVLGLAGAAGLFLAGKRLRGPVTGVLCAAAYLVGPVQLSELLGAAYQEGITSSALIASALGWLIWYREGEVAWLRASFLLAGLAVSYKLTAVVFPVALVGLTFVAFSTGASGGTASLGQSVTRLLRLLPLVVVPVVPWLARAMILTGNPVFPMFARLIPSRDMPGDLSAKFEQYNRYMVWGSALGSHWSLARRKAILFAAAAGLVVAGGLVAFRSKTRFGRGAALVITGAVVVQLLAAGLYTRYWIPILSVLSLPLLAPLEDRLASPRRRNVCAAIILLFSLYRTRSQLNDVNRDVGGVVATALGLRNEASFLRDHLSLFPIYEVANKSLPNEARVLLSGYCGGFWVDRWTYCGDFVQTSLRYSSWPEFVEDVHHLGITNVIAPRSLADGGPGPEPQAGNTSSILRLQQNQMLGKLLTEHGHLMIAADDQGLYALDRVDP